MWRESMPEVEAEASGRLPDPTCCAYKPLSLPCHPCSLDVPASHPALSALPVAQPWEVLQTQHIQYTLLISLHQQVKESAVKHLVAAFDQFPPNGAQNLPYAGTHDV